MFGAPALPFGMKAGTDLASAKLNCSLIWVCLKIKQEGLGRFWSMFPPPGIQFGTAFLSHSHMWLHLGPGKRGGPLQNDVTKLGQLRNSMYSTSFGPHIYLFFANGSKFKRRGKPQVSVHVSTYQASSLVPVF